MNNLFGVSENFQVDASTVEALGLLPHPTDFVQVPVELIRRIGANAAILLSRMHWRFEGGWRLLHEHGHRHWWEATMNDLAIETGLTAKQVRGALDTLVTMGAVVREKHRLAGDGDQSYSYRVRTAEEARSLLSTDLPSGANGQNTDVPVGATRFAPEGTSTSYETSLNLLNADGVGDEEKPVDKSGPFHVTAGRRRLATDAMVASGQAHAVPVYLDYLTTVDWGTGIELIRRWCGIQAAAVNGEGYHRADIDDLLATAGIAVTTDAAWRAYLDDAPPLADQHGPNCQYDLLSGYCDRHGLRSA